MRPPDKIIGTNYLSRWHTIPRNRFFNIYLHRFTGSDDDRALHDHPWHSVSILLKGSLFEIFKGRRTQGWYDARVIRRWRPIFRGATFSHRLVLGMSGPAWTLFITGPVVREWGFWCPKGWVHWSKMTTPEGESIGGCE